MPRTISNLPRNKGLLGLVLLMLSLPSLAHAAVGHFLFVHGHVLVTSHGGKQHQASKGMEVHEGESISSGIHGAAQLRMKDGAFLAVRPNTVLKIDAYAYRDKGRRAESTISLLKGTFRAISGKIGKRHPERDLVKTPVATIGIRGTDHEPAYIPPPPPGRRATTPPGTYDKVNKGVIFIKTSAGSIDLNANQVGHAVAANRPPVLLPSMPGFYRTPGTPAVSPNSGDQASSRHGNTTATDVVTSNNGSDTNSPTPPSDTSPDSDTPPGGPNAEPVAYSASAGSGQTVNLTDQTTTTGNTTTPIGTPTNTTPPVTYAIPATKRAAMMSWVGVPSGQAYPNPQTKFVDTQWGDTYTTNGSGNVTGWNVGYYNATANPSQQVQGSVSGISSSPQSIQMASGIRLGSYSASAVNLTLADSTTSTDSLTVNTVNQPFNWITGPGISASYMPM
ncbi:MAG TPA: FecR family protein, partial [Mariprofundaceae bacterium]|nr:FecR family protein [Mariprofundaceae bacterium]